MDKYLPKNIFYHQRDSFLPNVPGWQNWRSTHNYIDWKWVKNMLETVCELINEQRHSKYQENIASFRSSHRCNFHFVTPGHHICEKPWPIGEIWWPIIFSSLDMLYKHNKSKTIEYFFKLRILIFQCPGVTHITDFTRMPHLWMMIKCTIWSDITIPPL